MEELDVVLIGTINTPLCNLVVGLTMTTGEGHHNRLRHNVVELYLQVVLRLGVVCTVPVAVPEVIVIILTQNTIDENLQVMDSNALITVRVRAGELIDRSDKGNMSNVLGCIDSLFCLGIQIAVVLNPLLALEVGLPGCDDALGFFIFYFLEIPFRSLRAVEIVPSLGPAYEEAVLTRTIAMVVLVQVQIVVSILRRYADVHVRNVIHGGNGIDSHQVFTFFAHLHAGAACNIIEAGVVHHAHDVIDSVTLVGNLKQRTNLPGLLLEVFGCAPDTPVLAVLLVAHHVLFAYLAVGDVVSFFILSDDYIVDVLHTSVDAVVAGCQTEGNLGSKHSLIGCLYGIYHLLSLFFCKGIQFLFGHVVDVQRENQVLEC